MEMIFPRVIPWKISRAIQRSRAIKLIVPHVPSVVALVTNKVEVDANFIISSRLIGSVMSCSSRESNTTNDRPNSPTGKFKTFPLTNGSCGNLDCPPCTVSTRSKSIFKFLRWKSRSSDRTLFFFLFWFFHCLNLLGFSTKNILKRRLTKVTVAAAVIFFWLIAGITEFQSTGNASHHSGSRRIQDAKTTSFSIAQYPQRKQQHLPNQSFESILNQ